MVRWMVAALAACMATAALAQDAVGDWGGLLMGKLRIVVHVTKDGAGQYAGTLESPDQGAFVLPLEQVAVAAQQLSFVVPKVNGRYTASWDAEQQAWMGTWTQAQPLPLKLARLGPQGAAGLVPQRPQEDAIAKGERPYSSQDVNIDSTEPGVKLAGTLSVPNGKWGKGPFPAVLLVAGSGAQTRDEDVLGHKVFVVLADALNRAGLAVLRYDKRGVGGSTGNHGAATLADFAVDARAALAWLAARPEVDARRMGALGHSEGGAVAPLLADATGSASAKPAFMVLLAGPGEKGDKILLAQQTLIARADKMPEALIAQSAERNRRAFEVIATAKTMEEARQQLRALGEPFVAAKQITQGQLDVMVASSTSPWMRYFLAYDPVPALEKLRMPVLAINGSLDLQVPATENLAAIRQALRHNPDATVLELPGLNHLFQTAKTGSPSEYAGIAETVAPVALEKVVGWVEEKTRR